MNKHISTSTTMSSDTIQKQANSANANSEKLHSYNVLFHRSENLKKQTLIFNMEESLLKSTSMFPCFMLVAFEAGGLLRALVLLLLYPLLRVVDKELRSKIMVFVCFFGVRKKSFKIGRTVLPKYFLENVGSEGLEAITRFGAKVAVTNLPKIMVDDFLKDYLGVETVIGRELKAFSGHYLGLMEGGTMEATSLKSPAVGFCGSHESVKEQVFTNCSDIYLVSEADKENWHHLPKDKYPKPLIFHDGRIAFHPTPEATMVMFIWLPFGLFLCVVRIAVAVLVPYNISCLLLAFSGLSCKTVMPRSSEVISTKKQNGIVYVCNHKTLLDPDFISLACGTHLTAVTFSISKLSEILSPIKTVSLTRDKAKDAAIMQKVLSKGSIVVCAEGTTCREPYLLRFSPLFAEICDDIIPVAIDVKVSMFYGTTASGIKALDPFFFILNPFTTYYVEFLEKLPKSCTCGGGAMPKYDVANYVQAEIGAALGFQCTNLTRKDKYMILAGTTGI